MVYEEDSWYLSDTFNALINSEIDIISRLYLYTSTGLSSLEEMVARFVLNKINPLKKFKLTELINSNFNNIF